MLEQEERSILYGISTNPSTGEEFEMIDTEDWEDANGDVGEDGIDDTSLYIRCTKKDLVDKFFYWKPSLYANSKFLGNNWFMKDSTNDGDGDKCLTWTEVNNCAKLSVKLYNTEDFVDEPQIYFFNGKTGQFPLLTVSKYENGDYDKPYSSRSLVYLNDVNGVFDSYRITIRFTNIDFDDSVTKDNVSDMFYDIVGNLELYSFVKSSDCIEVIFDIKLSSDISDMNSVMFRINGSFNPNPDEYIDLEDYTNYFKNHYQHQYYEYYVDNILQTDTYNNFDDFLFTVDNWDKGTIITILSIEEDHTVEIVGIYKERSMISIATHKNITLYSIDSKDSLARYITGKDNQIEGKSSTLPSSAKLVLSDVQSGGSYICDYKNIVCGDSGHPREHLESAYFCFTVDANAYQQVDVYYVVYEKENDKVDLIKESSDTYLDDLKNSSNSYLYRSYKVNQVDGSLPSEVFYIANNDITQDDVDSYKLVYNGTNINQMGRLVFFLTERFTSYTLTFKIDSMFKITRLYVASSLDDLNNSLKREIISYSDLKSGYILYTGEFSNYTSNTIYMLIKGVELQTSNNKQVKGWYYTSDFKSDLNAYDCDEYIKINVVHDMSVVIRPSTYMLSKINVINDNTNRIVNAIKIYEQNSLIAKTWTSSTGSSYNSIEISSENDESKCDTVSFKIAIENTYYNNGYKYLRYKFYDENNANNTTLTTENLSNARYPALGYRTFTYKKLRSDIKYYFYISLYSLYVPKQVNVYTPLGYTLETDFNVIVSLTGSSNGKNASVSKSASSSSECVRYTLADSAEHVLVTLDFNNANEPYNAYKFLGVKLKIYTKDSTSTSYNSEVEVSCTEVSNSKRQKFSYELSAITLDYFNTCSLIEVYVLPLVKTVYNYYVYNPLEEVILQCSMDSGATYSDVELSENDDALLHTSYMNPNNVYLRVKNNNEYIKYVKYGVYNYSDNDKVIISPDSNPILLDGKDYGDVPTLNISQLDNNSTYIIKIYPEAVFYTLKFVVILGGFGSVLADDYYNFQWNATEYNIKDNYNGKAVLSNASDVTYASDGNRAYFVYETRNTVPETVSFDITIPDTFATNRRLSFSIYYSLYVSEDDLSYSPFSEDVSTHLSLRDGGIYTINEGDDNVFNFKWVYGKKFDGESEIPARTYGNVSAVEAGNTIYIRFEAISTQPVLEFAEVTEYVPTSNEYYLDKDTSVPYWYAFINAYADKRTGKVYSSDNWSFSFNTIGHTQSGYEHTYDNNPSEWFDYELYSLDSPTNEWESTYKAKGYTHYIKFQTINNLWDNSYITLDYSSEYHDSVSPAKHFYTKLIMSNLLVLTDNSTKVLPPNSNKTYSNITLGNITDTDLSLGYELYSWSKSYQTFYTVNMDNGGVDLEGLSVWSDESYDEYRVLMFYDDFDVSVPNIWLMTEAYGISDSAGAIDMANNSYFAYSRDLISVTVDNQKVDFVINGSNLIVPFEQDFDCIEDFYNKIIKLLLYRYNNINIKYFKFKILNKDATSIYHTRKYFYYSKGYIDTKSYIRYYWTTAPGTSDTIIGYNLKFEEKSGVFNAPGVYIDSALGLDYYDAQQIGYYYDNTKLYTAKITYGNITAEYYRTRNNYNTCYAVKVKSGDGDDYKLLLKFRMVEGTTYYLAATDANGNAWCNLNYHFVYSETRTRATNYCILCGYYDENSTIYEINKSSVTIEQDNAYRWLNRL